MSVEETESSTEPSSPSPPSRSRFLMDRYAHHNVSRGRGFLFGGEERADAMRSLLPGDFGAVLDLGCRDGALARSMGLTDRVVGVDIDMEALRAARGSGIP